MKTCHISQVTPSESIFLKDAQNRAAGAFILSKDTGRILMATRSHEVEDPNKISIFGGSVEDYETNEEGLEREIFEETNHPVFNTPRPLCVSIDKENNFAYSTYIILVPAEFETSLNWEHSEANWMTVDEVLAISKNDLHQGVAAALSDDQVKESLQQLCHYYEHNHEIGTIDHQLSA